MGEGIITLLVAVVIVLSIAWVLLPFLVAGVNSRLDKLIKLQEQQLQQSNPQKDDGAGVEYNAEPDENDSKDRSQHDLLTLIVVIAFLVLVAAMFSFYG